MFSASSPQAYPMQAGPAGSEAERVVINVGGLRHETYKSTLMCIPGTRLANLVSDGSAYPLKHPTSDFFFDRDPKAFAPILNYYRTGKLHCPADVCGQSFEEELSFWGVTETGVEACCWKNFQQHRDEEEALAAFEPDERPPDYDSLVGGPGRMQTEACMPKMWALFDDPRSSAAAMIICILSLLFILMSIICFCLGTHIQFQHNPWPLDIEDRNKTHFEDSDADIDADMALLMPINALLIIELVCTIWFTFEFLIRIISCPDKLKFILNVLNIIDFLAILSFYVVFILGWSIREMFSPIIVLRSLRLLRIFTLMRHVAGVRALGYSLRASACELFSLGVALLAFLLVFSTLALYAEGDESTFNSMSTALWWAVVTMTTLGYGDMYPVTRLGMVVGSLCAMTGVIFIIVPIPILVNKFAKYYTLTEAKQRRWAKRRRGDGRSEGASAPVWRGVENL